MKKNDNILCIVQDIIYNCVVDILCSYLPFNLLFLHVYKSVYIERWHIVKINCGNFRKQQVMLEDVAWKQERMMMSF